MSTDQHQITLTEKSGEWVAKDEQQGVERHGETEYEALQNLHKAVKENVHETTDVTPGESWIDPDDSFFSAPTFSSGEGNLSTTVDEVLYGPVEADDETE